MKQWTPLVVPTLNHNHEIDRIRLPNFNQLNRSGLTREESVKKLV